MRANIGIIRHVTNWHTAIFPWEPVPVFLVTNEHTRNKKWYAGAMAHEAWHSFLYHQWLTTHPGETHVPEDAWMGIEIEEQCLQKQHEALVQVKAPRHMLEYVSEKVIKTEYWTAPMRIRGRTVGGTSKTTDEDAIVTEILKKGCK